MIVQRKMKSQLSVYITSYYKMAQQSTASSKLPKPEKVSESFFCTDDEDVLKNLSYTVLLYWYTCFGRLHLGYQPSS